MALAESLIQIEAPGEELVEVEREIYGDAPISLDYARTEYFETGNEQYLLEDYQRWVKKPVWLIAENLETGQLRAWKGAKRGNDVYATKTMIRFRATRAAVEKLDIRTSRRQVSMVLGTLTYSTQKDENWETIGHDFNIFMGRLRRRYGRVWAVRTWEAHKSGFPHIHVILLFLDRKFSSWLQVKKDKKFSILRLDEMRVWGLNESVEKVAPSKKHPLKWAWAEGYSDWRGVEDSNGALNEVMKYLRKMLEYKGTKYLKTLAKLWVYRKRAFSISTDLIKGSAIQWAQLDLLGGVVPDPRKWRLVGCISTDVDLRKCSIVDFHEYQSGERVVTIIEK